MRKTNKLLAFAIVFAMVLSTMVMPVSANTAVENLYAVGSFESFTASDDLAPYVGNYGADDRKYTLMTDGNGANGTSNYVMMSDSTWSQGNFQTYAISNLKPGKTYRATVYLKTVEGTTSTPLLRLKQTGDAVVATGSALSLSDSEWTKATIDYTIPADDTKKNLIIQIYDAGDKKPLYVDEVSLVEYIEPITNLLSDSSFEGCTSDQLSLTGSSCTTALGEGIARTGSKSIGVTGLTYQSSSANTGWLSGLETGATYRATAYVKLQAEGTSNAARIRYRDTNAGNNPVLGPTFTVTGDAWTPISYEFVATSPNYQLQYCNYGQQPFYIDDISLKKVVANNPAWGTFEYAGDFANVSGSGVTPTLATDGNGAFGSENYVKVTGRSYQGANIVASFPLEEGKAYKLSGYVRLADGAADTQVTPEANYSGNGTIFKGTPVTAKAGVWTKFEVELAPNEIFRGKYQGHDLALKAVAPAGVDLWYDNFTLEEIAIPALTMTEDFDTEEAVAINSVQTITVDFSHDAYNFSGKDDPTDAGNSSDQAWSNLAAANFAVDNGATLAVDVVNNKQAVLTISDFAYGTTYTVTATGLTDYYGNTITDATVATFTTEEEPVVVIPDNLAEGKDLRGSACDVTKNEDGTFTVSNQTWTNGYKAFMDGITAEAGKKYVAVFTVKKGAGAGESDVAYLSAGVPSGNASWSSATMKANTVAIGDDWTKVAGIVEVATTDGSKTASINIGIRGGAATEAELFIVKSVELREISETLDLDTNYLVKMVDSSMYLHNPSMTGQSIYVYAVNEADDGAFESATMLTYWFNGQGVGVYELPEADKYFVWDAGMKPLCTPFTLGE